MVAYDVVTAARSETHPPLDLQYVHGVTMRRDFG